MNRPRSLAFSHWAATFGSSADSKALTACAGRLFKVRALSFCSLIALCLAAVWPSVAHACTPGSTQSCPPPSICSSAHQECIDAVPPYWGPCECDIPPQEWITTPTQPPFTTIASNFRPITFA